jgi:hypothetical protein
MTRRPDPGSAAGRIGPVPASPTNQSEDPVMRHQGSPTRPRPDPALQLLHGVWVASCPTCGFQLAGARSQARCERRAARTRCPVCHEVA